MFQGFYLIKILDLTTIFKANDFNALCRSNDGLGEKRLDPGLNETVKFRFPKMSSIFWLRETNISYSKKHAKKICSHIAPLFVCGKILQRDIRLLFFRYHNWLTLRTKFSIVWAKLYVCTDNTLVCGVTKKHNLWHRFCTQNHFYLLDNII